MVMTVKRKEKETIGALTRRFSRFVQQNGILLRAREVRFYRKPDSRNKIRRVALRRRELRLRHEKLKKLGKAPGQKNVPGR